MTDKYNGWTNYETWNYKLWIDNDSSEYWAEQAKSVFNDGYAQDGTQFTKSEHAALILMDLLKDECEEQLELFMADQSGPFADLLNGAVSSIDWHEIAVSLIEDNIEIAA